MSGTLAKIRLQFRLTYSADVMWALTAPELYEVLVVRRGWTPARYGEFIAGTMIAALLPA